MLKGSNQGKQLWIQAMNKKRRRWKRIVDATLLLAIAALFFRYVIMPRVLFPIKYTEIVEKYSREYGVDKNLVYAVIRAESSFRKEAVSHKNAVGLMQISESTAKWGAAEIPIEGFTLEMLAEPAVNIEIGCWYLAKLISQYDGNCETALAAYNGGSGNVGKWLSNEKYSKDGESLHYIPFEETKKYVKKVLALKKIYDTLY